MLEPELSKSREREDTSRIGDKNENTSVKQRPRGVMSAGQEFAVSAIAAGLAHVIHHPLYTLKSQMMFYGPDFRMGRFFKQAWQQKHNFLYRGLWVAQISAKE